jgi:hypothetical protein
MVMHTDTETTERAFHELVRIMEGAIQARADSVGLEYEHGELIVYFYCGHTGLGEQLIPKELEEAVIDELVKRAGLSRRPNGKMAVTLMGKDFEVLVEQYQNFDEPAFTLTFREGKKTAEKTTKAKPSELISSSTIVLANEPLRINLSAAQRQTILKYAKLPDHLSERLTEKKGHAKEIAFTLDELDELLDRLEGAAYAAKGNERQKVHRIVDKVSGFLGSWIDPDEMPGDADQADRDTVFQIKMTLLGIDPPIWRRIQTQDCTLEDLHEMIQVTMGWEFDHLFSFEIGGVQFENEADDPEGEDAAEIRLSNVLPEKNRRPRFVYVYDFGDNWTHQLIVEERFPPKKGVTYPICVGGARACPPEDCGGCWGYADLVEALHNPEHGRHEEIAEWMGDDFDPERFDKEAVNKRLRKVRATRA